MSFLALIALMLPLHAALPVLEAAPFVAGEKATVLVFLATECPVANAMAPELARLAETYVEEGVAFYRVYCGRDVDADAIAQHGVDYRLNFPAIHDADYVLARASEAEVTPEAVVLDTKGARVYRGRINNLYEDFGVKRQVVTQHDLRDAIEAVLNREPVAEPETQAIGCYIDFPEKREAEEQE